MKRISQIFILSLLLCAFTSSRAANVVFFTENGESFSLAINGIIQNVAPVTNVNVTGVNVERIAVRIIFGNKTLGEFTKSGLMIEPNMENAFMIRKKRRQGYKIVLIGRTPIGSATDNNRINIPYHTEQLATIPDPYDDQLPPTYELFDDELDSTATEQQYDENGIPISPNTPITIRTPDGNTEVIVQVPRNYRPGSDGAYQFASTSTFCNGVTMADDVFSSFMQDIDDKKEFEKTPFIHETVAKNCLSSSQIASIVGLIPSYDQLDIAQYAYQFTYDTENYALVFQALSEAHDRTLLLEYITGGAQDENVVDYNSDTDIVEFPTDNDVVIIDHPYGEDSPLACYGIVSQRELMEAKEIIANESFSSNKEQVAKQFIKHHCFTTYQVQELLEVFSFDKYKLSIAKFAYPYTADQKHYYTLFNSFSYASSKDDLAQFLDANNPWSIPNEQGCYGATTSVDFQIIRQSIREEDFRADKMRIARQALSGYCVTVAQVSELMQEFSFEADQLELAKFAYAYTSNPQDYYQLIGILKFKSSKDALSEFLERN